VLNYVGGFRCPMFCELVFTEASQEETFVLCTE